MCLFLCFQFTNDSIKEQDLEKIINLIKIRLNIFSIECDYKSTFVINPKLCNGEYISSEMQFKFKYQDGNFFISAPKIKKKINITENNPRNLLEVLAKKFNIPSETSITTNEDIEKIVGYTNLYFYKGKASFLRIGFDNEKNSPITYITKNDTDTQNEYGKYYDPRGIIGFIGFNLDSKDAADYSFTSCYPRKITELLDIHGETQIRREGDYTVLFHCIKNSCDVSKCIYGNESTCKLIEEYKKWLSFEIWIDNKDNIKKIIEIDYLPIIYGADSIKKICGINNNRKFFPFEKRREFTFDDFSELSSGVRVPLKANIITFRNDYMMSEILYNFVMGNNNLIEDYKKKKISAEELRLSLNCYGFDENLYFSTVQLEINPDTLKVNDPIPEENFIAPSIQIDHRKEADEDRRVDDQKGINYKKPILFITAFVIFTLLSIFITRRYFKWGI